MIRRLLNWFSGGPEKETPAKPAGPVISCYAKLNEKIEPIERGDRYEEPLGEALLAAGLGSVEGGGTMMEKSGEIDYAGIDVDLLESRKEEGIRLVCDFLTARGAPKGSVLRLGDGRHPFGQIEGIAIYFDGVNLPDEVYKNSDINLVWSELDKRVGPAGKVRSHWQGPTETALYLYGPSAETMRTQIADFMASYPLCRGARIVTIAPAPPEPAAPGPGQNELPRT